MNNENGRKKHFKEIKSPYTLYLKAKDQYENKENMLLNWNSATEALIYNKGNIGICIQLYRSIGPYTRRALVK